MESALDDEPVVLGGQLRVVMTGEVGCEPDVASQARVTLFGDSRPSLAVTGLIHTGDHSRERADCRKVGEAVGVTEAAEDPAGKYWPDTGSRLHDSLRVSGGVELGDALIEPVDLGVELSHDSNL
jgi:hypothetical protein